MNSTQYNEIYNLIDNLYQNSDNKCCDLLKADLLEIKDKLGKISIEDSQIINAEILEKQTQEMRDEIQMLKNILGGVNEWILVTDASTGEIIYANEAAMGFYFNPETESHVCGHKCGLLEILRNGGKDDSKTYLTYEYDCPLEETVLSVISYKITQKYRTIFIHYIEDITEEVMYKRQIEEMAYVDELTGLFNRRYCQNSIETFMNTKIDFSLCMIDMDGLKFVNDTYGHLEGDEYIKAITDSIKDNTRSTDVICRIGGDEIVVLFPKCTEEVATRKMTEIDADIKSKQTNYNMSISFGVVHVSQESGYIDPDKMIEIADEKMYVQKRAKKAERKN